MKNSQKGFIIPLVVVIVALVIGGGAYFYFKNTQFPQIDSTQAHVSSQNTPAEQTTNQSKPVISLISPASTTPQSLVTITGSGFVGNNDIKFTSMSQPAIVAYACGARAKNNNTSILFGSGPSFQDPLVSDCKGGLGVKGIVLQPGLYEVSVINNNGISNSVPYTISSPVAQVDETVDWETYANTEFHYSIKYPKDLKIVFAPRYIPVSDDKNPSFSLVNFDLNYNFFRGLAPGQIMIKGDVYDASACGSGSIVNDNGDNGQEIMIDGVKVIKYVFKNNENDEGGLSSNASSAAYFFMKDNCFMAGLYPYPVDKDILEKFDQILSTFKFTSSVGE